MLKKVGALLAGVILTCGCAAGLSETDVDARIESAVSTAIAEIPTPQPTATPQPIPTLQPTATPQPTIFTAPLAVVRAQSYEIVSPDDGQLRATLSLDEDGRVSLEFLDADGMVRAWFVLLPDGIAAHVLADAGGVARAGLTVSPEGEPRLLFQDEFGNIIASYP